MVDFQLKNGTLRVTPSHVKCLWQGTDSTSTFIVVGEGDGLAYEVLLPIDEVEKKLKAEISDLGTISNQLLQLSTSMRPKV